MKKKKSLLLFLLAVASTTALGAVGCDEPEPEEEPAHQHSWTYASNSELHWEKCTDSSCDYIKNPAVHEDVKNNQTNANEPDNKCDVCGAPVEHKEDPGTVIPPADKEYQLKHNDSTHWFEEEGGEKHAIGAHYDVLNNETKQAGKDGLCDTCGYIEKDTVTFVTGNTCTAPEASTADYGSKIEAPSLTLPQGIVLEGWYTDADLTNKFNFETDTVTADLTLHAKFKVDETPGVTAQHPIETTLGQGAEKNATFGENKTSLFFSFTSAEFKRYSIVLDGGAAGRCTYKVSGGEAVDGAESSYVDIQAGKTVVVEVLRGKDVTATMQINVIFNEVINEPLPEDAWLSGTYTNGAGATFELSRENKNVTWMSFPAATYNYVGGSFDKLTFTVVSGVGTGTFTVVRNGDNYTVTCNSDLFGSDSNVFTRIGEPVPREKLGGVYVTETSTVPMPNDKNTRVVEVEIYENAETVRFIGSDGDGYSYDGSSVSYKENVITIGGYKISLDLDREGNITGITINAGVTEGDNPKPIVTSYTKTDDPVPDPVPASFLGLETNAYYAGNSFFFKYNGKYTYYGNTYYTISVDKYVKATNSFSIHWYISKDNVPRYKLVIEGSEEEDNVVIKWYDEEGEELLDTLTKIKLSAADPMPTESTDLTLSASDFKINTYHLKVQSTGWYKFTTEADKLQFYILTRTDNPLSTSTPYAQLLDISDSVNLTEGNIILVYNRGYSSVEDAPSSYTVNVAPAGPAKGYAENNPINIDALGKNSQTGLKANTEFFYTFTAPKAGYYLVTASAPFKVNGDDTEYTANQTAMFVVSTDSPVKIKVTPTSTSFTFTFEEDCSHGSELTPSEDGKGTISASGAYYFAGLADIDYATNLVLGSADGDDFVITINGETTTVKTQTFTAAQLAHGFVITLEDEQTVAYAITYASGAKQNPVKITAVGAHSQTLSAGMVKYFTVTAPEDKDCLISATSSSAKLLFVIDGTQYGYTYANDEYTALSNTSYKLTAGTTVTVAVSCGNEELAVDFNLNLLIDYTEEAVEIDVNAFTKGDKTEDGMMAAYQTLSVAAGKTNYHLATTNGSTVTVSGYSKFSVITNNSTIPAVSSANGIYQLVIPAGEDVYFELSSDKAQHLTFVLSYEQGTQANPYTEELDFGLLELAVKAGDTYIVMPEGGTYVCEGSGTLYVNDAAVEQGKIFTVAKDDVVVYKATRSGTVYISLVIDAKTLGIELGKYEYTDGETAKILRINSDSIVLNGNKYWLSHISGNEYTFAKSSEDDIDTVTLTITSDSVKYGDKDLTFKAMFPDEAAQKYTGSFTYLGGWSTGTMTLTLTKDGTVTVTGGVVTAGGAVDVTDNEDGTYSFTAQRGSNSDNSDKATFKFAKGGVIEISFGPKTSIDAGTKLNPTTPWEPEIKEEIYELKAGTYTGKVGTDNITLTVNGDGTVTHVGNDGTFENVTLTETSDGKYSYHTFVNAYWDPVYTITVIANGTLSVHQDKNNIIGTLVNPNAEPKLSVGTYTGKVGTDNITLTVNGDGTVTHVGNDGTFENVTLTETSDGKYSYHTFVSAYWDPVYTITVNSDGTLSVHQDKNNITGTLVNPNAETSKFPEGEYTGTGTFLGDPTTLTLTINAEGKGTFAFLSVNANITVTKSGDTYSFKYNGNDASFTVNADGTLTLTTATLGSNITMTASGSVTPEPEPEPATDLTAGTYVGSFNSSPAVIVINENNTVNFILNPCTEDEEAFNNLAVMVLDGTYSFTIADWDNAVESFKFNTDGSIEFTDDFGDTSTYSVYVDPEYPQGAYVGEVDEETGSIALVIATDKTATFYTGIGTEYVAAYATGEISLNYGVFSFTYYGKLSGEDAQGDITLTFTVSESNSILLDGTVLTLDSEFDTSELPEPEVPEASTYVGELVYEGEDETYTAEATLVINGNAATYTVDGVLCFEGTLTYDDGVYSFSYNGGNSVTFTVNEDGSIELSDSWNGDGTLTLSEGGSSEDETPSAIAGIYSGQLNEVWLTLAINDDLSGEFTPDTEGDADTFYTIDLVDNGDGSYSFSYEDAAEASHSYTLTVNEDGTLTLEDSAGNTGALNKRPSIA